MLMKFRLHWHEISTPCQCFVTTCLLKRYKMAISAFFRRYFVSFFLGSVVDFSVYIGGLSAVEVCAVVANPFNGLATI